MSPPQVASQGPQEPTVHTCRLQVLGLQACVRGAGCTVALHDATSGAPKLSPALQMAVREARPPSHCALQLPYGVYCHWARLQASTLHHEWKHSLQLGIPPCLLLKLLRQSSGTAA